LSEKVARVSEAAVWSALLLGVWIVTLSSVSTPELAVAAACAVLAAIAAVGARIASGASWSPSPRWITWLVTLPVAIVADAGRIFGMALAQLARGRRRQPGDIRDVAIGDRGESPRAAARRALATLLVASTPSSVVVDARPDDPNLVVHQLVDGKPSVEKVVSR
jgi:multisubunit Na+/H+ antiporter MnhE subunit